MINRRIHLIRHGKIETLKKGQYIGRMDVPLSGQGKRELEELRESMDYPYVQKVFTGPLSRCIQSARILYPGVPFEILEELNEFDLGEIEGMTLEQLKGREEYLKWMEDSVKNQLPGAESSEQFRCRCEAALEKVYLEMNEQKLETAAVVTHGGVIMTMLAALGLPRRPLSSWAAEPGKGYTLLATPGMWMRDHLVEVFDVLPLAREEEEEERNTEEERL